MSGSSDRYSEHVPGHASEATVTEIGSLESGLPVPRFARMQQLVISPQRLERIEGGRASRFDRHTQAASSSRTLFHIRRWLQIREGLLRIERPTMRFLRHGSGVQWAGAAVGRRPGEKSLPATSVAGRRDAPLAHRRPGYPSARLHACRACLRFARHWQDTAPPDRLHHWTPEPCLRKRIPRAPPEEKVAREGAMSLTAAAAS